MVLNHLELRCFSLLKEGCCCLMITTAEKSEQPVLYLQSLVSQSWPQKHLSDNSCLFTCVVIRMETDPQWSSVSLVFPWRPGKARLWLKTCWDYCGEGSWHADLLHRFRSSCKTELILFQPSGSAQGGAECAAWPSKGLGLQLCDMSKTRIKSSPGLYCGTSVSRISRTLPRISLL